MIMPAESAKEEKRENRVNLNMDAAGKPPKISVGDHVEANMAGQVHSVGMGYDGKGHNVELRKVHSVTYKPHGKKGGTLGGDIRKLKGMVEDTDEDGM